MEDPAVSSQLQPQAGEQDPQGAADSAFSRVMRSPVLAAISIVVLCAVNLYWYWDLRFKTIMGDDAARWTTLMKMGSVKEIFTTADEKYRPILDTILYLMFKSFGGDFMSYWRVNLATNCVLIAVFFLLVWRLTKRDAVMASGATLLLITTRFAYYDIIQVYGVMEIITMILMVAMVHAAISYVKRPRLWLALSIVGVYTLELFIAERYMVLLPFMVVLFFIAAPPKGVSKWLLIGLSAAPLLVNAMIKKSILKTRFFVGPQGKAIGPDPLGTLVFLKNSLLDVFWFNAGKALQDFEVAPERFAVICILAATIVAILVWGLVRLILAKKSEERARSIKAWLLFAVLFVSLLLSTAVTFRQELRWMTGPFIVLIAFTMYVLSTLPLNRIVMWAVVVAIAVMGVSTDVYYRGGLKTEYFYYSQQMSDSAVAVTYGTYGEGITKYTLYIEKQAGLAWILDGDNFLSPYVGIGKQKSVWLDSLDDVNFKRIDPATSRFYRLDWPKRQLLDLTDELLKAHPEAGSELK